MVTVMIYFCGIKVLILIDFPLVRMDDDVNESRYVVEYFYSCWMSPFLSAQQVT